MNTHKNISFIILIFVFLVSYAHTEEMSNQSDVQVEENQTTENSSFVESILFDAFEKGNSLIIVKVLSLRTAKATKFHFFKVKIIQPIIMGDLTLDDIQKPIELFAGTAFGNTFDIGSTYALFISKGSTDQVDWSFRNDVVKLDELNNEDLQTLQETANKVYEKTSIRQFRESKLKETTLPSDFPSEIIAICEKFKEYSDNRNKYAEKIYESDIGSRQDYSELSSSTIKFLPPKIILSREEILTLLGEPTLKCGWDYKWFCGIDTNNTERVGILLAKFNQRAETSLVLYDKYERVKWKQAEVKESDFKVGGVSEWLLGFDKLIQVGTAENKRKELLLLSNPTIQFSKTGEIISALVNVEYLSWPETKWKMQLDLLDSQGKILKSVKNIYKNSGIIAYVPFQESKKIRFELGNWEELRDVVDYKLSIGSIWRRQSNPIVFNKSIPLSLRLSNSSTSLYIKSTSIMFEKTDNKVRAIVHSEYPSWPKAKWKVKVKVLNSKGKTLVKGTKIFENSGIIEDIAVIQRNDLDITLGDWLSMSEAKIYEVTIERLEDTKISGLQFKGEGGWGETVNGLQCRLRAIKTTWNFSEEPAFSLDLRNVGNTKILCAAITQNCEIDYDGQLYKWAGPIVMETESGPLRTGKEYLNAVQIKIPTSWATMERNGVSLELTEGRHIVRVHYRPEASAWPTSEIRTIAAVSNPVEIEILPEAKSDMQVEENNEAMSKDNIISFNTLDDALEFIIKALENDEFDNLSNACVGNYQANRLTQHIFKELKLLHDKENLPNLYKRIGFTQEFPKEADKFKLGGHNFKVRCIHIDFVKKENRWYLEHIWKCK